MLLWVGDIQTTRASRYRSSQLMTVNLLMADTLYILILAAPAATISDDERPDVNLHLRLDPDKFP